MQNPDDSITVFLGKRRLRPSERGWRERRENFRNLSVSHLAFLYISQKMSFNVVFA
jgi:hypothetical protein